MKKLLLLSFLSLFFAATRAIQIPETENYILTEDPQQVLDTQGINDPIRDGAFQAINPWSGELDGILWVDAKISDHSTAQNQTLQIVKNIINYVLGFLALIALVYLIYNGFLILTAAGDDAQYKKGMKSIEYAVIAIAGIGASWFIVSLIFRLINLFITP